MVFKLMHRRLGVDLSRDVLATLAARAAVFAMSFFTNILIARSLGPTGRGEFASALAFSTLCVQFGNLGLHASNTYFVAQSPNKLNHLFANTISVTLAVSVFITALVLAFEAIFPGSAPVSGLMLLLSVLWIPFGLGYVLLQNLLLGRGLIAAYNWVDVGSRAINMVAVLIAISVGASTVMSLFGAGLLSQIAASSITALLLYRLMERRVGVSWPLFRSGLTYGAKAYLGAFFAFIVLKLDVLIVKYLAGDQAAGHYSIAASLGEIIGMAPVVLGTLLFPRLAAMSDRAERWMLTKYAAQRTATVMLAVAIVCGVAARPLVAVLFGSEFLPAAAPLAILLPGIVALSVNVILMNHFAAEGMPLVTVYSPGIAAVLNVILNLILVPRLGISGSSIASTICYGLMLGMSLLYVYRRTDLNAVKQANI
jgi:O-antigen/teichoic acid export membrane protein